MAFLYCTSQYTAQYLRQDQSATHVTGQNLIYNLYSVSVRVVKIYDMQNLHGLKIPVTIVIIEAEESELLGETEHIKL